MKNLFSFGIVWILACHWAIGGTYCRRKGGSIADVIFSNMGNPEGTITQILIEPIRNLTKYLDSDARESGPALSDRWKENWGSWKKSAMARKNHDVNLNVGEYYWKALNKARGEPEDSRLRIDWIPVGVEPDSLVTHQRQLQSWLDSQLPDPVRETFYKNLPKDSDQSAVDYLFRLAEELHQSSSEYRSVDQAILAYLQFFSESEKGGAFGVKHDVVRLLIAELTVGGQAEILFKRINEKQIADAVPEIRSIRSELESIELWLKDHKDALDELSQTVNRHDLEIRELNESVAFLNKRVKVLSVTLAILVSGGIGGGVAYLNSDEESLWEKLERLRKRLEGVVIE